MAPSVTTRAFRFGAKDSIARPVFSTEARIAALTAVQQLGLPEGRLPLVEAAIYLAAAPKSNAAYMAYNKARATVKQMGSLDVPMHLRNAPTQLMKQLDYGKGYRYAHDEEDGFAAGEKYLPEGMAEPGFYRPVRRGLEIKIDDKMRELREKNLIQGNPRGK